MNNSFEELNNSSKKKISELMEKNNIKCLIVPPATTSYLQPLDVSINGPLKAYVKVEYDKWFKSDKVELTRKGNAKRAPYSVVARWVKDSFEKISNRVVAESFETCGISIRREYDRFNSRLKKKLEGSNYKDKLIEEDFSDWDEFNACVYFNNQENSEDEDDDDDEEFFLYLEDDSESDEDTEEE